FSLFFDKSVIISSPRTSIPSLYFRKVDTIASTCLPPTTTKDIIHSLPYDLLSLTPLKILLFYFFFFFILLLFFFFFYFIFIFLLFRNHFFSSYIPSLILL